MKKIIAFAGKKGSGKDTAARLLISSYGYKRIAFADSLKNICKLVYTVTEDELNDRYLKDLKLSRYPFKSPRTLMKETADALKTVCPDIFLKLWLRAAEPYDKIVVPDLRLRDELNLLTGFNAQFLRILRPNVDNTDTHASEIELDGIDLPEIDNNGTVEDLENAIRVLIENDILKL